MPNGPLGPSGTYARLLRGAAVPRCRAGRGRTAVLPGRPLPGGPPDARRAAGRPMPGGPRAGRCPVCPVRPKIIAEDGPITE